MSGSGYYRFRCKNFYTHNCENWVWVNNSPCAECVMEGKESTEETYEEHSPSGPRNATLPFVECGCLGYIQIETTAEKPSQQSNTTVQFWGQALSFDSATQVSPRMIEQGSIFIVSLPLLVTEFGKLALGNLQRWYQGCMCYSRFFQLFAHIVLSPPWISWIRFQMSVSGLFFPLLHVYFLFMIV